MKRVVVGYFNVPGFGPDSVETPFVGKASVEYAALAKLIKKRHPKCKELITRSGSVVELRDASNGFVEVAAGTTIAQLFEGDDKVESSRIVGKVFFSGAPMVVHIVLHRAAGSMTVRLSPVLRVDGAIRFQNVINPQRLATELPLIIKDILGNDARNLTLNFREVSPKPAI